MPLPSARLNGSRDAWAGANTGLALKQATLHGAMGHRSAFALAKSTLREGT